MHEIDLLEDSNTEALKKTVENIKDSIKPYEKARGVHFIEFVDFVKRKHPDLNRTKATKLFKAIQSTWNRTAPKMFIVELLREFAIEVVKRAEEEIDPSQTEIPQAS